MERGQEDAQGGEQAEDFYTYHDGPTLLTLRPVTTDIILGIIASLSRSCSAKNTTLLLSQSPKEAFCGLSTQEK